MMLNVNSIEDALIKLETALDNYGARYSSLLTGIVRTISNGGLPGSKQSASHMLSATDTEQVVISSATGRILAENIISDQDVPGFNRSTVDGYAVRAADTFGASQSIPAMLRFDGRIEMGHDAGTTLGKGSCREIATGGALPEGADAVVMVEDSEPAAYEDESRFLLKPVSPGQNVIFRGDDITKDTCLLSAGTVLKAHHIGALAALGISEITVLRKLKIALISTGNELKSPGQTLMSGQIYDVNTDMLRAILNKANTDLHFIGIIADELDQLHKALGQAASDHDLIIMSGGSSADERDHAAKAINLLGKPGVIQHGLAVKPGKPTLIGLVDRVPIIGLPGHPVAAWFMTDQIVLPLIDMLCNKKARKRITEEAILARALPANHGRQSFIAVRLENRPDMPQLLAHPVASKSGLITTLRDTDGYIIIDRDQEGLNGGSLATVYLWEEQ